MQRLPSAVKECTLAHNHQFFPSMGILRKNLCSSGHVLGGFKDGIKPDIDELGIGLLGRVCKASNLVVGAQVRIACCRGRLWVQAHAGCTVCPDMSISLIETKKYQRQKDFRKRIMRIYTFFLSLFAWASEIILCEYMEIGSPSFTSLRRNTPNPAPGMEDSRTSTAGNRRGAAYFRGWPRNGFMMTVRGRTL